METISVVPAGREYLAFSYEKPADWRAVDLPAEEPNYDDPKYFEPIAAAASEYGVAVFSVGARMRYPDGTLREWLEFLCREDNIEIEEITEFCAGAMRGFRFDARQSDGTTTMIMRNLYVEDGGVLYAVCAMAAEQIYSAMADVLAAMTESFRIAKPDGPTVDLYPVSLASFASTLGFALSVPAGWNTEDAQEAAVLTNPEKGITIRIEHQEASAGMLKTRQSEFPDSECIFIEVAGQPAIGIANVAPGFYLFSVHPAHDGASVFVAKTTTVSFPDGLSAANQILSTLTLTAPVLA
ncbi:MAG: hypothetical protein HYX27_24510 [Acidobacteria bacterium]|nr:hypothetical protein [Acidobacteriota bacterium]